jgi:ABC-type branched-subunit amino acid transport system substrate-binding protein
LTPTLCHRYDLNRKSIIDASAEYVAILLARARQQWSSPGCDACVVAPEVRSDPNGERWEMRNHSNVGRKWLKRVAAMGSMSLVLAACSSGSSSTGGSPSSSGGAVTIGSFSTYTGPNAALGPEQVAGCYTAALLINKAGGILGHKVVCLPIDDRGDPADGVAAATKALATTTNLAGTLGPGGQATAVAPVFEKAGITMFADSGDSAFNHTTDKYFWRITPPDSAAGYAMALWARHLGYTRGAAVFAETTTAQTSVPTLLRGFAKLGGQMVATERLVPLAPSYQSEAARVLATHPQVIFTEADPQTDATFFKELTQLNGGKIIPIVGTQPTYTPQWQSAVGSAIGKSALATGYVALQPYAPPQGSAYLVFKKALLSDARQIKNPQQYVVDPYTMTDYDGAIIMALAMLKARSIKPSVYNSAVMDITQPGPGKTLVYSFAQGKAALAKGLSIRYIGAGGAVAFNQWHNNSQPFSAVGYTSSGGSRTAGIVKSSDLARIAG